jgi:hypothetical protein
MDGADQAEEGLGMNGGQAPPSSKDLGNAMQTMPMTMQNLMHNAQSRGQAVMGGRGCLAYPEMADVPPAFNRLAHTDFAALSESDETLDWDDYCPAYALGLLSYEAYCCGRSRNSEEELKDQWNQLRGASRLEWYRAKAIIARSWNALIRLGREEQPSH